MKLVLFLLVAALCACSPATAPIAPPPTVTAEGIEWTQDGSAKASEQAPPEAIATLGFTNRQGFVYRAGTQTLEAEVFAMKSPASAFEAMQKWRTQPEVTGFHHGSYFVVCRSRDGVGQKELLAFAGALGQAWQVR